MKTCLRWMAAGCLLAGSVASVAQDKGVWRAMSTTAHGVTGDIILSDLKITIAFSSFTIAQIRTLKPEEVVTLFNVDSGTDGLGNLYRLSIPAGQRFQHKNTLCGSDETQWMVTYGAGKNLEVAFFSGVSMPVLTPDALNNNTNLCGTYAYVR